jgi:hypothetical protein
VGKAAENCEEGLLEWISSSAGAAGKAETQEIDPEEHVEEYM